MRQSLVVLFHRIGPYHFARLRAIGRVLPTKALEMSSTDNTYAWDPVCGADDFERVTLFEGSDSHSQPSGEVVRRVQIELAKSQPAVVAVNGWSDPGALGALQWCMGTGTPAIMMSESTVWDEQRVAWKEWIKSRIVKLCSAGMAGGTPHLDYLVKLGLVRERAFAGYDAVDNKYFSTKADESRKQETELRKQHGLPERYFLASARFIEKKNFSRLLQAYAQYRQLALAGSGLTSALNSQLSNSPWSLVLLGDGPLKSAFKSQLSTLNLHNHVLMPGFVQYPDLPVYYGLAGAFVHPSTTEQWGLVVNEAMASGLPVLVSNRCGCAQDLVQEGLNGFTFDPCNVDQLAKLMVQISSSASSTLLSPMGDASRKIISHWGPERFATGLEKAVDAALSIAPPRITMLDRILLTLLQRRRPSTEA